ncbi:MAG: hypothetical protein ACN2B6_12535 [Rickettsiales bacterium]
MTEQQFNLMHGFFLSITSILLADTFDRAKFEREANAAAEMMDKQGIPFGLQNIIAAAAADGRDFPLNAGRVTEVRQALGCTGERLKTLEDYRRSLSDTLKRPVTVAEVLAARL